MSKIEQLSLKSNFSWNFIGSLIYSLSQFLILMLLAKLGTPEIVGLYSIGLAITAPIVMLTNLQLRQVQATDTSNKYLFNDYFGLRIVMSLVVVLLALILSVVNGYEINKIVIILLVALTKIMDSYSDVVYGFLQQRERMDYIGKSRIIKGILTIITTGILFLATNNLVIALVGMNVLWFLIFILYDRRKLKLFLLDIKPKFNVSKFKTLIILTLPLGIVLMLGSLNANIPKIIVDKFIGEVALGYFASVSYLLIVGSTFIQAVGQAVAPRLAKHYHNKKIREFKKIIFQLSVFGIGIGFVGVLVAIFIGEYILTIIYDVNYSAYNDLLIIIMIAGIFSFVSSFLGYGITAMRIFKIQPYIGGVAILVTIISSLILVPMYGLKGAAYVLVIGAITELSIKIIVVNIFLNKNN